MDVTTLGPTAPTRRYDYVTDGAEIYRRSFATIRAEARLDHLPEDARVVAVRMDHADSPSGRRADPHGRPHDRLGHHPGPAAA